MTTYTPAMQCSGELAIDSEADSVGGKTLVTLYVRGEPVYLFPLEANALAEYLTCAANLAEGV